MKPNRYKELLDMHARHQILVRIEREEEILALLSNENDGND